MTKANKSPPDLIAFAEALARAQVVQDIARVKAGQFVARDERIARSVDAISVFDDDNPEWTAADFANARPASEVTPKAASKLVRRK